jgi:cell division septation protein DedD
MPNLNLKGDQPEDISDLPDAQESEPTSSGSGGSKKVMLQLIAGGVIALLLAFYILNKIGIVHLWGNKKASSMMVVSVQADSASQVLSDSMMTEQFKKDSIEAVSASAAQPKIQSETKAAASSPTQEAVPAPASAQKAAAREEQKRSVEKGNPPAASSARQAAAKTAITEIKPSVAPAQKNITTVEVPGVRQHASAAVETELPQATRSQATRSVDVPVRHRSSALVSKPRAAVPHVAVARPVAVEKAPLPPAQSTEAVKTAGEGQYTVQLSSWMSKAKAQAFASRFTRAGIPAFISTEGHVHRVCTGHFATMEAATANAETLVPMLESKYDIIMLK